MGSKHKRRESTSARLAMFKLEEAVGRRELGELRKVYDEKVDRLVSMLVLPSEALPNSKSRRSFTRQFDAAKTLEHPGIVPLLEGGTNDGEGHGFLVTDYVEGQTLRKRLSEGPLPAEEAIGLAVDVLNALAYAHSRKHLHGGLSPDNVLVVEGAARPRARLAHFGFHAVVGEERESAYGGLRVDPAYAAPEQVRGEPPTTAFIPFAPSASTQPDSPSSSFQISFPSIVASSLSHSFAAFFSAFSTSFSSGLNRSSCSSICSVKVWSSLCKEFIFDVRRGAPAQNAMQEVLGARRGPA